MALATPFLTALDSRAAVKGSRDPLGVQQIWSNLGREIVGNLTTVTNSLRDFTITLMGYHFADQISGETSDGADDAIFLKWEQIAAYARYQVNQDTGFRGTEKVQRVVRDGKGKVRISADPSGQILSDQRIYGLWGLYTVASRTSGLLDSEPDKPTPEALELIESVYLPRLQKGAGREARRIIEILGKTEYRLDIEGADERLISAVASILVPELTQLERDFYREHLLYGWKGDTCLRQKQMAQLLRPTLKDSDFVWSLAAIESFRLNALEKGDDWFPLGERLRWIRVAERVLAPATELFSYLLGCDGMTKRKVTDLLNKEWGPIIPASEFAEFRELESHFHMGEDLPGRRWVEVAWALAEGDYSSLITLLFAQNQAVMSARGTSAPWGKEIGGKLEIRLRDEVSLIPRDRLAARLRFPYFLDSLRDIGKVLV
jgi:hypothetical protein